MKQWTEYIKPVTVLLLICLLAGIVLSGINLLTAPAIAVNDEAMQSAAYFAALPEAEAFTELECSTDGVTAALAADNGKGYVIAAQSRGYGGMVPVVVAFSSDGTIQNVVMMDNGETPGMGSKVADPSFIENFTGRSAVPMALEDIDAITGATISSRAALNAVNLAITEYQSIIGGDGP